MEIKKLAVSGVKWTSFSTIVLAASQIIKISILTRFLEKSEFGLVAIVTFILGFVNLFIDMGITTAILHKSKISSDEYSSLFWLNVIFSLFFYLFIVGVSPIISAIYNEPDLVYLICVMALSIIFGGFGRQFRTIEQKKLNFKILSIVDLIAAPASLILAIVLAILNYGVLSLVYSSVFMQLVINIFFFINGVLKYGIKAHFVFKETRSFLSIGLYQTGGQIINYFNRDLDILIVGKFLGTEVLGGYSLAKQLVFRPAQLINPVLTKVTSPILSKIQNNKILLKEQYLKLVNVVFSINFVVYFIIILFSNWIVILMYGLEFQHISILVKILALFMLIRSIGNPVGSLVIATGKTKLEFYWNIIVLLTMPIAVLIGVMYSIEVVAICITFTMIILFYPSYRFMIAKMIEVSFQDYMKSIFAFPKVGKL